MKILSKSEADQFLSAIDLRIGDWNEVMDISPGSIIRKMFRPTREALPLYVLASTLLQWIGCDGRILLQIDNSTAPADDEAGIFERLMFSAESKWDIGRQKSFLFDEVTSCRSSIVLIIFFSLVFEWHVYLVSDISSKGVRLALLDGFIYFFGDMKAIEDADVLVSKLAENPLQIVS